MTRWLSIRHSIFFKFSLAFLTVGLIPLLVLGFLALNQFSGQVERHTENNFRQMILYVSRNVDDTLRQYNEFSKMMYYNLQNREEMDIPVRREIDEYGTLNQLSIDDFLRNVLFSDAHIQNAIFVRESDGQVFKQSRTGKLFDSNQPFPPVSWSYALTAAPNQLAVFPPHLDYYFSSTDQVITFARQLNDISGKLGPRMDVLGTLFFDVDMDLFDALFKQTSFDSRDEMVIVDNHGYILYSNQRDRAGRRFEEPRAGQSKIVFSESIPFIGGRVVGLAARSNLFASLGQIRATVILVSAICFLALLLLGMLFSQRFTRPILSIMRQMVRVESGQLDPTPVPKRKDELGRLAYGFQRMIERLRQFIDEAYVAEIKHKQTELNALKSQIQPHYLYNTLEAIRMTAVANDDEEAADMIHSLSHQLEYMIDYGEQWVTVGRELEHLDHYFRLISARYGGRIELQIELEDGLARAEILKLTLQPLVENAVQHGIRTRGGHGKISVTIETGEDGKLWVTVMDNGIGIDEARLEQIRKNLEDSSIGDGGRSIGIRNVHERLRYACGEDYGLELESRYGVGTSIRMKYPLRKELDTDGHDTSSIGG
ncbi:sensor histidine kinase [Paenibacillus sp. HB172176]|uniref:cache domain-containing sensor histidine kinase n=1 Tax=Paenibacillus sp. HB172176 TaxID=2493690 RepID=UPI00143A9683|nr:sensor histidine kinase [Paenibacillus sp. HB172176]